ncbi:MAG: hypothetical protein AAGD13_09945 [Pseudomonadota bacterium]
MKSIRPYLLTGLALMLAACGTGEGSTVGGQKFKETVIEKLSDDRFAISVSADNIDGYQLSRCVAAAYAESLRDAQGNRIYGFVERQGGKLTDTFRLKEGVRTQTTEGVQTFRLVTTGVHDGTDMMDVDLQLAECEQAGLPSAVE